MTRGPFWSWAAPGPAADPGAGGRRRLQVLLAVVAIVQGIWGELRAACATGRRTSLGVRGRVGGRCRPGWVRPSRPWMTAVGLHSGRPGSSTTTTSWMLCRGALGAGGPPTRTQPEQDRDLSYRPPAAGWHAVSAQEVLEGLGSAAQGLRQAQAARRLERVGPNSVEEGHCESLPEALLESLREPLQLLLIVVGVLSAIWGELRDAIAIFAIIAAVAGVETASEWRARKALDALRSLTAPRARALRDGQLLEIPARELVPGDVVALEAGDVVPADCRIIDASGLGVDESALTGEPPAGPTGAGPVASAAPLAARSSMVFSGTAVVDGEGTAVVVATGAASELGRLGRLVAEEQAPVTPLQQSMGELARVILVVAIAASVLVPLVGVLRGQPLRPMVLAGLTLAFATIPEELPILVTVLLAVGGRRLAQRGALLRRLRAGETLGALTVVVTDKTGTLTENRLRLAHLNGAPREVLEVAVGCQSLRSRGGELVGDPLEVALAQAASQQRVGVEGAPVATFPLRSRPQ